MKEKKTFCFDIDNTICNTNKNLYKKSKEKINKIKIINKLHDNGYKIVIYTARYMGRCKNNYKKASKMGFKSTYKQLKNWGLKFDELYFGKPSADFYIDDKSLNYKKNWHLELKKKYLD